MAPLALYEITLDCPEPRDLAEFYRRVLGWFYHPGHEDDDPDGDERLVLVPPCGGTRLAFQRSHAAVPPWPGGARAHLDVRPLRARSPCRNRGREVLPGRRPRRPCCAAS